MQRLLDTKLIKKIKSTDIFETLKHGKNYFSADIATKAIAFVSIPIFTRLFTQADYGIVAVFGAYVGIITVILSLNSYTAVGRYYYEKTNDFGAFIGTTLTFVGLIFGLTLPIYILFYNQIASLMQLPGLLPIYLLFACLFAIIYSLYYQILVPQKRSKEAATISILNGYIGFGIAVLFVYLLTENRYLGQIWATLLIGLIFSIYFMIKIRKYSKFCFKIEHIKYIATYSFPLIPYALSGIILAQFDRIMINDIIDTASAGLYSLGYNVGMLLLMVIGATQTAWMPDFFKLRDNKEYDRFDALIEKVFSIVTIAALGLVLFAKEIVMILADEKFHPGLCVVPLVVIGYVFFGMSSVYGVHIGYKKKTVFTSIVALTAGISNIVLNAIYIPKYGYIAAAYTTVASYFIMFLLTWIVSKIVLKQRVTPLWMIWKPTLLMFCFIGFVYFLDMFTMNAILFFVIKLMILALFGIIVFYKEIKIIAAT
jgi:O-antigen/teichoic acid export membrane protein